MENKMDLLKVLCPCRVQCNKKAISPLVEPECILTLKRFHANFGTLKMYTCHRKQGNGP